MSADFQGQYQNSKFIDDSTQTATIPSTGELFTASHTALLADELVGVHYVFGLPGLRGSSGPVWGNNVSLATGTASGTSLLFTSTQTVVKGWLVAGANPTSTGWRRIATSTTGLTATVNSAFDVDPSSETIYRHGTLTERLDTTFASITTKLETLTTTAVAREYVFNSATSNATDTSSFATGESGGLVPGAASTSKSYRVQFSTAYKHHELEFNDGTTTAAWVPAGSSDFNPHRNAGVQYGAALRAGPTTTQLDVIFAHGGYEEQISGGVTTWASASSYGIKYRVVGYD